MQIGFVGLGKLGLPVAVTLQRFGHDVMGTDLDQTRMRVSKHPEVEDGLKPGETFNDMLAKWPIQYGTLSQVAIHGEVIFVAIQTPHLPMYSGSTRLPTTRSDFNYTSLRRGLAALFTELAACSSRKMTTVAVISTVLPGTMGRLLSGLKVPPGVSVVYTPQFIAMGTVVRDFANPEFILIGEDEPNPALYEAFDPIVRHSGASCMVMSVASAEVTKVIYNTFITAKITISNLAGQVCHETPGANVSDVSRALASSTRRIAGPDYLKSGMGDGGGCHPRDNIAMSWLAQRLDLHADLFTSLMVAREHHARWFAHLLYDLTMDHGTSVMVLGVAFKPNTALVDGSHANVLIEILTEEFNIKPRVYDPVVRGLDLEKAQVDLDGYAPDIIFVGCAHDMFLRLRFSEKTTIVDPFRYLPAARNVVHIGVGR